MLRKKVNVPATHLHDRVLTSLTRLKSLCRLARRCRPPGRLLVERFVPFPFLHHPVAIVDPYLSTFYILYQEERYFIENFTRYTSVNFSAEENIECVCFASNFCFVENDLSCFASTFGTSDKLNHITSLVNTKVARNYFSKNEIC